MSKTQRGIRDGTGSFEGSFRKQVEGKSVGRRIEAGEECPVEPKEKEIKEPKEIKESKDERTEFNKLIY